MKTLKENLYIIWTIGTKDILDVLRNKSALTNFLLMLFMVVFFYWLGTSRPFDKDVSVVVYDQGNSTLMVDEVFLPDGSRYSFRMASSLEEMKTKMANQNLGLVLPADVDTILSSEKTLVLQGYIFWVERSKVADLEVKYSQAFSTILNAPVKVEIGENIVIPQPEDSGMQTTFAQQMIYFVFMVALGMIPMLLLEEKQTKTLEALMTSPASPGQIVMGKAVAGFFYIFLVACLALILYAQYIVNWGLALVAVFGYVLFAVGLGLLVGSFMTTMKQIGIWVLFLMLFLVVPPLFFMEPNLKAGIRIFLTWFPSSALSSLLRFSCTTPAAFSQVLPNLVIVIASILLVLGLVVWKVKRSDR